MAGTIYGLGLSQQFDADRNPLSGAKLYIYQSGTSTPVTIYEDFALANEHPFPLEADSAGRIPAFWVADGSYRVRLTDASGIEIFDENSITAIGASSGTGGGGSGVSDDQIFQTGDPLWVPTSGTRSGWVRLNARTIGSSSSGATERANADCETLFLHLWNNYTNTAAPVTGGRGASAAADWAANKTIAPPDMRGRGPFGVDDMGSTAAGVISGGTTIAAAGGASETSITLTQGNIPNFNLDISLLTVTGSPDLNGNGNDVTRNFSEGSSTLQNGTGGNRNYLAPNDVNFNVTDLSVDKGTLDVGGTLPSGGSGTALEKNIMNPYRLGTWYMKL